SADAVIFPLAPTFTVATANTPVPVAPGMSTMPFLPIVAASATMSGIGVADEESSSVFTPPIVCATSAFGPANSNVTSVGVTAAVGVNAMTNVWPTPGPMSAPRLGVPVTALVAGSVVWKLNPAATDVATLGATSSTLVLPGGPACRIVTNAVAGT